MGPIVPFEWMGILWTRGMVGHPNLNVRALRCNRQQADCCLACLSCKAPVKQGFDTYPVIVHIAVHCLQVRKAILDSFLERDWTLATCCSQVQLMSHQGFV